MKTQKNSTQKTFSKLNSILTAALIALIFNSCEKEDTTSPSITGPTTQNGYGRITFWTDMASGWTSIDISVNGTSAGSLTQYHTSTPDCYNSTSGVVTLTKPAGAYNFSAHSNSGMTWDGTVTFTDGGCTTLKLGGGGGSSGNTLPSTYDNQGTITVHSQNLQICARDFSTVDGDKIDLIINGTTYLSNYTVSGTDHCINVTLPAGNNWIGIIAKDEGSISPCTPGITIDDGISIQNFEIRSTVAGNNGAYIINVVL